MDSASLEVHHRPEVDCLLCAERILKTTFKILVDQKCMNNTRNNCHI